MNRIHPSVPMAHPTFLVELATSLSPTEPAIEVTRALADAVDRRTEQLIAEYVACTGTPPAEFVWVALGSHARRELHCASNQSHALVWATADAAASRYARGLAEHVMAGLEQIGMRRGRSGYTADRWSHSATDWADRLAAPTGSDVGAAEFFLDVRPVTGPLNAEPLLRRVRGGATSHRILRGLAREANSFGVPLTVLGRLPRDGVDLKVSALAPIAALARLYGLVAGSPAIGTRERLEATATNGVLSPNLAGRLDFAYTLCTRLRLHSQLRQVTAKSELTDTLPIADIAWQDQGLLRNALRSVRAAQGITAMTYRIDL